MDHFAVIGKGYSGTYKHYTEALDVLLNNVESSGVGDIYISMTLFGMLNDLLKQAAEIDIKKRRTFDRLQCDIRRVRTALNHYFIFEVPGKNADTEDETRC